MTPRSAAAAIVFVLSAVALAGCAGSDVDMTPYLASSHALPDDLELMPEDSEAFQALSALFEMEANPDEVSLDFCDDPGEDNEGVTGAMLALIWSASDQQRIYISRVCAFEGSAEAEAASADGNGCESDSDSHARSLRGGSIMATVVGGDSDDVTKGHVESMVASIAAGTDLEPYC